MKLVTVERSLLSTLLRKLRRAESSGKHVEHIILTEAEYAQLRGELGKPVHAVEDVPLFVDDPRYPRVIPAAEYEPSEGSSDG